MALYVYAALNGDNKYLGSNDIVFNGTWMSSQVYVPPMDAVNYGASQYIVLIQNSGSAPLGSGAWSELVLLRPDVSPPGPDPTIIAEQALDLANESFTLACIGTNVGTNALNLAQLAYNIAVAGTAQSAAGAYNLAAIGTNVGTNALNAAAAAQATANNAIGGINGVTVMAMAGTNIALEALGIAINGTNSVQSAYNLAAIGTNVGTNALVLAARAEADAQSALSGVGSFGVIAQAGTNLATEALNIAVQGTNIANEALSIAIAGTNAIASTLTLLSAGTTFGTNIAIPNGTNFVYVGGLNLPFTPSSVVANVAMPTVNDLNLYPTLVGKPTTDGFVVSLNGQTDSSLYRLHFQIRK